MSKDIETKVKNIVEGNNLSDSQLDRLIDPKTLLFNYLASYVGKIQQEDELLSELKMKFLNEIKEGTLSAGMELKIFEILSKKQSEDSAPIINLFSKALEVKKDDPKPLPSTENSIEGSFTQEEFSKAKKLLNEIDKLKVGEFSPKEFLKKKE